ncbi:MAG TPA: sulfatase-like hydrolase/transferase [Chloroflexota bacterium]|nr:sulfatase-like hydrolase/transferase [Chloroflexota bacterium]
MIITDQQRYDTIAALGYPYVDTPHLDRLAREGVAFTNCFVAGASCAPSRASLFSGCYPHTAGVMRNADVWRSCWVEDLAAAGYHCVNVGKMHTYPFEAPSGFHERYVVENKDRYLEGRYFFDRWDLAFQANGLEKPGRVQYRNLPDYHERLGAVPWPLPEHLHPDVFVGNLARWWVEHKPVTQPLFLEVGFPGPHPPYDPIQRYLEPYLQRDLPLPKLAPAELDALPPALKELRVHNTEIDHDSVFWSLDPTPEQLHRLRAHYLANVTMIDEQVGLLLQALEAQGYLEDAVVIFTSDHGDCLGDHGQIQKWTMHDEITRVPMIVWSPRRFGGGRRVDTLWQQMDLAPAIMGLAGVPVPETWEAISLAPALYGTAGAGGRERVFCEQAGDNVLTGTDLMTMVRTRDWKLVHYLEQPDGELYDLRLDPGEHKNLWRDSEHAPMKGELLDALLSWRLRSGLRPRRQALVTS